MQEIHELGAEIEDAWRGADYHAEEFAAISKAALERRTLPASISTESIFRWFVSSPQIPTQPHHQAFGDPPIQLYRGRRFYIEALFWADGTTSIHQHSFSGAFQVLLGGSIHTMYDFDCEEEISRDLLLGSLSAKHSELLCVGDVRPILSGNRLIHSLFHLDEPSLTIVVRTKYDSGTDPQYSYLHPGIAYDPVPPDDRLSRLLRLLDLLDHRSPGTTCLLAEAIERADLGTIVAMLMRWFRAHPVDADSVEQLLAVAGRRHPALAARLRRAAHEGRRQALIINRRRKNRRPDHRFFLALLLNVGNREQVFAFVKRKYPDSDPVDRIVSWMEEIAGPSSRNAGDQGGSQSLATAEYDLGEAELEVLNQLLRQRTPEEIFTALGDGYDAVDSQRQEIFDLCASLTGSALLQPLFRA